jgi:3-methylcrotonyl-CoA carboxylase alpha subunit
MFSKILVANRGEIACRVMRTARKLGIQTVAVYSDADAHALHVQTANEAVHIGGSSPAESYLNMQRVIEAAQKTGAQAIHPGYGFLSENEAFCKLCAKHNIVFIGPPAGAIRSMGSKSAAKQIMETAGVPLLPGYHGSDQDAAILKSAAEEIGYPVLLKAVSGGGGKGMRQVPAAAEFDEALAGAKREAQSSFGDDAMLVEKYLQQPRHVEVQVFFDNMGNGVYLFERDCSVQRRHQKIIEEAPAPNMPAGVREQMGEAALRAAKAVNYAGAGTVEFLLEATGDFYFMEMNTRLQVEHPVTEMITDQDLVEWQLKVAAGQPLPLSQDDLSMTGHAFEARIYAEDPANEFLPAAGTLNWLQQPADTAHVRIDTGVLQGDEVGVFYDPMIAKLIVWDENRTRALHRLSQALAAYRIVGVTTNIEFLQRLAANPAFANEDLSTEFIPQNAEQLFAPIELPIQTLVPLACLYLILKERSDSTAANTGSPWQAMDNWRANAPRSHTRAILLGQSQHIVTVVETEDEFVMSLDDSLSKKTSSVSGTLDGNQLIATIDGHRQSAVVLAQGSAATLFTDDISCQFETLAPDLGEDHALDDNSGFKAPMNGTVVDILVSAGDTVSQGDALVIMEAMKMEHTIKAPADGTVTEIYYGKGDLVDGGADLLAFET